MVKYWSNTSQILVKYWSSTSTRIAAASGLKPSPATVSRAPPRRPAAAGRTAATAATCVSMKAAPRWS